MDQRSQSDGNSAQSVSLLCLKQVVFMRARWWAEVSTFIISITNWYIYAQRCQTTKSCMKCSCLKKSILTKFDSDIQKYQMNTEGLDWSAVFLKKPFLMKHFEHYHYFVSKMGILLGCKTCYLKFDNLLIFLILQGKKSVVFWQTKFKITLCHKLFYTYCIITMRIMRK